MIKTIGSGKTEEEIEQLVHQAQLEINRLQSQPSRFPTHQDHLIKNILKAVSNSDISIIDPKIVLEKIYDKIGYHEIDNKGYFRHLVISRLLFPGSKLKTVDYLYRFQQIRVNVDTLYRYMDKLQSQHKDKVELITFRHSQKVLKGKLNVVFYVVEQPQSAAKPIWFWK